MVVSRSVTIYSTAPVDPNTYGNGVWNAYVYNANNFSSNYSGYFTTASALSYSTTADYLTNQPPSTAATYLGCQVNQTGYSVRFQRTNFTPGVYQIDITNNDDDMAVLLNGTTIYSFGTNNNTPRSNVWTGTLGATSQLEFRYSNTGGGPGYMAFTITSVTKTASSGQSEAIRLPVTRWFLLSVSQVLLPLSVETAAQCPLRFNGNLRQIM